MRIALCKKNEPITERGQSKLSGTFKRLKVTHRSTKGRKDQKIASNQEHSGGGGCVIVQVCKQETPSRKKILSLEQGANYRLHSNGKVGLDSARKILKTFFGQMKI